MSLILHFMVPKTTIKFFIQIYFLAKMTRTFWMDLKLELICKFVFPESNWILSKEFLVSDNVRELALKTLSACILIILRMTHAFSWYARIYYYSKDFKLNFDIFRVVLTASLLKQLVILELLFLKQKKIRK